MDNTLLLGCKSKKLWIIYIFTLFLGYYNIQILHNAGGVISRAYCLWVTELNLQEQECFYKKHVL